MTDLDDLGTLYLGAVVDEDFERTPVPLLYDASDLTTHAVIVGMTGSGKTGLGIGLIEEAALDGVPVLVVDPKGDMGNLALAFPELSPTDFEPWIDQREAKNEDTDLSVYAGKVAARWREGLNSWGLDGARIARFKEAAGVAVYTPGSTAGRQLSLLASFAPPPETVMSDQEALADRLSGVTASLLTLVGRDPDPLGRDHLLVSAVMEASWREGAGLDLAAIVRAVQDPPVRRLGVMDLETVFPTPERMKLAMALNALLASPSFSAWTQGEPLDVQRLLYEPDGKPRVAVLTVSHLSDAEREFFLTLLFTEVVSWTRSRTGTASLRALVYVDELFGMMPPVAEPPTKRPLLTLLKQARAFGVGLVLSTQNPVDLDYKGLSNAGTWFIGRLQTERDKQRLLEGLRNASGKVDVTALGATISALPKRTFVMRNVREPEPVTFQTRWAMSYLAGPMSREQIAALADHGLNSDAGRESSRQPAVEIQGAAAARIPDPVAASDATSTDRPVLPHHLPEVFAPRTGPPQRTRYYPFLLGVADVLYQSKTHRIDVQSRVSLLLELVEGPSPVEWSRGEHAYFDLEDVLDGPEPDSTFAPLPAISTDERAVRGWRELFERWLRVEGGLGLWRDPASKLTSRPDETEQDFRLRCAQAARERRDLEVGKLRDRYGTKIAAARKQLLTQEQAVAREQQQFQARALNVAGSLLGAFMGNRRRSVSTALNRASMGAKDFGDVKRAKERREAAQSALEELEETLAEELSLVRFHNVHPEEIELESVTIRPKSRDVAVRFLGIAWVPFLESEGHWVRG